MVPYTRYYWKELTQDGRFVDAEWANPKGYEHSDQAICHFHMKFSVGAYEDKIPDSACWHLMKFYGVRMDD